MSARLVFDEAPLGALIRFSDGAPKPPLRFAKKLAAWRRSNGVGRLIRKTPPSNRGGYVDPGSITLHEGDFGGHGVVVLIVHRTHGLDSDLSFEILDKPTPGSWRVVRPFGETTELLHLAGDRSTAESWLSANLHPNARIEPVENEASAAPLQAAATTLAGEPQETR